MNSKNRAIKMLARNGWKIDHGLKLFGILAVAVFFTWQAWYEMVWASLHHEIARPTVLVLPIIVWLVWVRRSRFRYVRPGGSSVGLIMLVAGIQLFVMSHYFYSVRSASHLGAVLILAGAFLTVTGKTLFYQFLPAWLILPFIVAVPESLATLLSYPIQLFEAHFIAFIYGLFGFGIQIIETSSSSRMIVGGKTLPLGSVCKGLPTMLSMVFICYGFVYGSPMRSGVRVSLILVAPFIALLCSAAALGGTLWLYSGQSALVTADLISAISQWATLLITFLLIIGSVRLLAWASVPIHQYPLASTSP